MKFKPKTLRGRFLTTLFLAFIITSVVSAGVQLYILNKKMEEDIHNQVSLLTEGIQQGIGDTEKASQEIEKQIDLKMVSYSREIATRLEEDSLDDITNEELSRIKNELGLAGITIIGKEEKDELIGLKSTDQEEIGFSFKNIDPSSYEALERLIINEPITEDGFMNVIDNIILTPILESGSHEEGESQFFKYAYSSPEGKPFIINPYIEANEVNEFTQRVGPDLWIERMERENPIAIEMAVLNPRVFEDESLAQAYYPPLQKIEYGEFKTQSSKDKDILIGMLQDPKEISYIDKNSSLYKVFVPVNEDRVIYVALNYDMLKEPVVQHSYILLVAGILSLLVLFILAGLYFNKIYANIQKLKNQMEKLAKGDLTAKSSIKNGDELSKLSESANQMVDTLHYLIENTNQQAANTQRLSLLLKSDAKNSVDKLYYLSMETTAKHREAVGNFLHFLDTVEEHLEQLNTPEARLTLEKVDEMRQLANERAATTTDITITLSDLVNSLYGQSKELTRVSENLLENLKSFKT